MFASSRGLMTGANGSVGHLSAWIWRPALIQRQNGRQSTWGARTMLIEVSLFLAGCLFGAIAVLCYDVRQLRRLKKDELENGQIERGDQ